MKLFNLSKIICGCFCFLALQGYSQEIEKSIFITANTGTSDNTKVLEQIIKETKSLDNTVLLILGNAVSKEGFNAETGRSLIDSQLKMLSSYKGQAIFAPGDHEWAKDGHKGVRRLEKYIQKNSDSKFYPDEGCPIKKKDLSENAVLITVDSQWFLEDWNNHIYLNEDCDIKNRTDFFLEFENLFKKGTN